MHETFLESLFQFSWMRYRYSYLLVNVGWIPCCSNNHFKQYEHFHTALVIGLFSIAMYVDSLLYDVTLLYFCISSSEVIYNKCIIRLHDTVAPRRWLLPTIITEYRAPQSWGLLLLFSTVKAYVKDLLLRLYQLR